MDEVRNVALALEAEFKSRVENGSGLTFEETGVSLPKFEIWESYAKVAIAAFKGEMK